MRTNLMKIFMIGAFMPGLMNAMLKNDSASAASTVSIISSRSVNTAAAGVNFAICASATTTNSSSASATAADTKITSNNPKTALYALIENIKSIEYEEQNKEKCERETLSYETQYKENLSKDKVATLEWKKEEEYIRNRLEECKKEKLYIERKILSFKTQYRENIHYLEDLSLLQSNASKRLKEAFEIFNIRVNTMLYYVENIEQCELFAAYFSPDIAARYLIYLKEQRQNVICGKSEELIFGYPMASKLLRLGDVRILELFKDKTTIGNPKMGTEQLLEDERMQMLPIRWISLMHCDFINNYEFSLNDAGKVVKEPMQSIFWKSVARKSCNIFVIREAIKYFAKNQNSNEEEAAKKRINQCLRVSLKRSRYEEILNTILLDIIYKEKITFADIALKLDDMPIKNLLAIINFFVKNCDRANDCAYINANYHFIVDALKFVLNLNHKFTDLELQDIATACVYYEMYDLAKIANTKIMNNNF